MNSVKEMTAQDRERVVEQAIAATSLDTYKTRAEKEVAVAENALLIARLLADDSFPNRVLRSVRLVGDVKSVEFEESSQRYIVTFETTTGSADKPKTESVRTDRLCDPTGHIVQEMVGKGLVGHRCIIFKETVTAKSDASKKVRIASYIRIIK